MTTNAEAVRGAALAAGRADRMTALWSDRAYAQLVNFRISLGKGGEFLTEEIRQYAEKSGLPAAPDSRAWGHIILRAKNEGMVEHTGRYERQCSKTCHGSPKSVWRFA